MQNDPYCFFTEVFHDMGYTYFNKEEGRDYPASPLPPTAKQALWHPSSTANKENALKLFINVTDFSSNHTRLEN